MTVKTLMGSLPPARGGFLYEKRPQSREMCQVFIERKLMVMLTQLVGSRLKQAVVGLPLRFQSPCAFNYLTKVHSNSYYSVLT
jgi:hypothetical protein